MQHPIVMSAITPAAAVACTVRSPGAPIREGAFSLIEVMIAIALLATIMTMLCGNLFTLSQAKILGQENAKVQALAQILVERIQGADFSTLGQYDPNQTNLNAWSWHRRVTPLPGETAPLNPPMTETIPSATFTIPWTPQGALPFANCLLDIVDTAGNHVSPGLLHQPTSLYNLSVYLEYYRMTALTQDVNLSANPQAEWANICSGTVNPATYIYPESRGASGDPTPIIDMTVDPSGVPSLNSAIIRVYITWTSQVGGSMHSELVVARRQ
jgi:type II secretory pathway pseudopilin PulG